MHPEHGPRPWNCYQFRAVNGTAWVFYAPTFREAVKQWLDVMDSLCCGRYEPPGGTEGAAGNGQWTISANPIR